MPTAIVLQFNVHKNVRGSEFRPRYRHANSLIWIGKCVSIPGVLNGIQLYNSCMPVNTWHAQFAAFIAVHYQSTINLFIRLSRPTINRVTGSEFYKRRQGRRQYFGLGTGAERVNLLPEIRTMGKIKRCGKKILFLAPKLLFLY
jgi:hypothetical protein